MQRNENLECHFSIVRFALRCRKQRLPSSLVSAWPSFCPFTSLKTEECVFKTESVLPETETTFSAAVTEVLRLTQDVTGGLMWRCVLEWVPQGVTGGLMWRCVLEWVPQGVTGGLMWRCVLGWVPECVTGGLMWWCVLGWVPQGVTGGLMWRCVLGWVPDFFEGSWYLKIHEGSSPKDVVTYRAKDAALCRTRL
jgi:hypothetical protein